MASGGGVFRESVPPRVASCRIAASKSKFLSQVHGESGIRLVTAARHQEVPAHRSSQQRQVADEIKYLVAYGFILKPQRWIEDVFLTENEGRGEVSTADQAGSAKGFDFVKEAKGARRRDLFGVGFGRNPIVGTLMAQKWIG